MKHEEEVAIAMTRREGEIMEAVRTREADILEAWKVREEQIRKEAGEAVEERMKWVNGREEELEAERLRLDDARVELEAKVKVLNDTVKGLFIDFILTLDLLRTR
jgi:NIMA (never in mitosis gene a)-related kinase